MAGPGGLTSSSHVRSDKLRQRRRLVQRLVEVLVILYFVIPPFLRAGGHDLPVWARAGSVPFGVIFGVLQLASPLVALYFLVRFVKWAWTRP